MRLLIFICLLAGLSADVHAASVKVIRGVKSVESLKDTNVQIESESEFHLTRSSYPAISCKFNLSSEDAWLFFDNMRPYAAAEEYLPVILVDGTPARLNENIRVVQYGSGTVMIPHSPDYQPLEIFAEERCSGDSEKVSQYTVCDPQSDAVLGADVGSFVLKRGYMATFAENADGTGRSKVFIAQDSDLEVPSLGTPIRFIRVFPWRWTAKKGGANLTSGLNLSWWYNWNISAASSLDMEYVAIKQKRWWPGLDQDWRSLGVNHLLGYNEPDRPDQANMSVDDAIAGWPELLKTGLRLGSPAVSDGGLGWLYEFMDKAKEKGYRVDFVAVHYYRNSNGGGKGAAKQFYNVLKGIHERTGKPIWITEWNNGANWTSGADPTPEEQAEAIGAMIEMLDEAEFVERYAIYNWVEDCRRVQWNDGSLTDAGAIYRDQASPVGYVQKK